MRALARLDLPAHTLLVESGIDPDALDDPDGRIPAAAADDLWSAAYRRSGDDRLAVHAVETLEVSDYRTLNYLAANCATVGESLRRILGFFDLVDRRIRWTLEDTDDLIRIRLHFDGLADPLPRAPVEYTLGALIRSVQLATGVDWRPLRVEVGFPDPGGEAAREHERVLGPMRYGAGHTAIAIAAHWWRHPVPDADGTLAEMLTELAHRQIGELPVEQDLLARVRRAVGGALVGGPPVISEVARQVGVSERSLQRRLAEQGTGFREEVDVVRQRTASMLLEDPNLALSEVSWLLGFSDPRAFTRAFRRWKGTTPSAWRTQAREGGAVDHR